MILQGTPDIADLRRDRLMIENRTWNATVTTHDEEALDPISLISCQVKTPTSPQQKAQYTKSIPTTPPLQNVENNPTMEPMMINPTSSLTLNNRPKPTAGTTAYSSYPSSSASPAFNNEGPVVQVHTFYLHI